MAHFTSTTSASDPTYLQTLGAVTGYLDRGLAHCRDNNIDPQEIVETRLHGDMAPFRFQIVSVAHHSLGAKSRKQGRRLFGPAQPERPPRLRRPAEAGGPTPCEGLGKVTREEVEALEGGDMTFQIRDFKVPFIAEGFLLSFSLPNFYFHATTAYDILRSKGVPLGKRDFMGQMRTKS